MIDYLQKIVFVNFIFLLSSTVSAQVEANYWTHQYGSKGLLLNGAVIASPDGETSAFYNPGAIGMDDELGFLFSFVTPTYSDLTTRNILGTGSLIRDRGFDFAPGFFGLRLRPFKNKKITIALSNFKRFDSSIRLDDRAISKIKGSQNLLSRIDLDFKRKISESWRGVGISYMLNKNIGIGLSQFSVWHKDQFDIEIASEIISEDMPNLLSQYLRTQSSYRFNLSSAFVSKLGLSYKTDKLCLGMTYTSPLYGAIHKTASYKLEYQLVDNVNDISSTSSNRNNTSDIIYKSPHSLGFGFDIHRDATSISFSTEYFFGIKKYSILDELDDSFDSLSPISNETLFKVESENDPVINFAVGVQTNLSAKTILVFGFRTDFSPNNTLGINDNPDYLGIAGDIYHFSGGNMINFKNNQFSCGFDIGFAKRNDGNQIINFDAVSQETFPDFGGLDNVTNRFRSFMIFVTYDFIFDRFKNDEK